MVSKLRSRRKHGTDREGTDMNPRGPLRVLWGTKQYWSFGEVKSLLTLAAS